MDEEQVSATGRRISNFEWGFVLAVMATIDLVEFILDFFVIGGVTNRFIDIICALGLIAYLKLRKAYMDTRAWASIGAVFVGEMIPVVDALPLWTADTAYLWSINSSSMAAKMAGKALGGGLTKKMEQSVQTATGAGAKAASAAGAKPPVIPEKAPTGARPPVIPEKAPAGAVPPKIPDGRKPLPRRLPPEREVGEADLELEEEGE